MRALSPFLVCVGCAVLVGVIAACGGDHRNAAFANGTELAWMKKFGDIQGTVANCLAELHHQVGPPPTMRLEPAYRLFENMCRVVKRERVRQATFDAMYAASIRSATLGITQPLPSASGSFVYAAASTAASQAAHQRIEARCWSKADWAQLVSEHLALVGLRNQSADMESGFSGGSHAIELAPEICTHLQEMTHASDPEAASYDTLFDWSQAVITVAHEAFHSSGISSESTAECFAIQMVPKTAAALGMDSTVGDALARNAWYVYPTEPRKYQSAACHRGGVLDLGQSRTVWK